MINWVVINIDFVIKVINHLMEWYDLNWIVVIELVTIGRDGTTRLINLFVIGVGMIIAN